MQNLQHHNINSANNKATGIAPYEALCGYLPRFEEGLVRELTENCETYRDPREVREEITKDIENAQKEYNKRYLRKI